MLSIIVLWSILLFTCLSIGLLTIRIVGPLLMKSGPNLTLGLDYTILIGFLVISVILSGLSLMVGIRLEVLIGLIIIAFIGFYVERQRIGELWRDSLAAARALRLGPMVF